jgi:two-component system chemotaxis response regulator CheY
MNDGAEDMLRLPAVLDLAAAENFLGTVHQHLQTRPALCLDASGVETLTLPCAQIILAALATRRVSVVGPSDGFESAFRDLALDWKANVDGGGREEPELPPPIAAEPAPEIAAMAAPELLPSLPALGREQEPEQEFPQESVQAEAPDAIPVTSAGAEESEESIEQEPSQSDQTDGTSMAKRILTIDDSKTMRDMLMLTLEEAGFEVLQAVDGQHGLDVLGHERVDVIITDINMPKLDGYGVIRNLRSNPVHKTTPILVLTTESDAEKKVIAREAGATGWMVKPFDPDRLIATIRKVAP